MGSMTERAAEAEVSCCAGEAGARRCAGEAEGIRCAEEAEATRFAEAEEHCEEEAAGTPNGKVAGGTATAGEAEVAAGSHRERVADAAEARVSR